MDTVLGFFKAFLNICTPYGLSITALGTFVGILGGALPGVSTTMTVALLAVFTMTMEPLWAIIMLAATQVGATYGGSISSTVLNIPGNPNSVPTMIEGYALTKQGLGELCIGVNVFTCFMANNVGVVMLLASMPYIVKTAMKFGPWEVFWFAMFGIIICANLSEGDNLKAYISGAIGLILGTVGIDGIDGSPRFAYGITYLTSGIQLIPAMVGVYGLAEVFQTMTDEKLEGSLNKKISLVKAAKEWWKYRWLFIKTCIVGYIIGVAPGIGANASCWVGYDMAKRSSPHPERFGRGAIDGVIGAETCNNANVPGAYAPVLALGVPGDAPTAIILGILLLHGVQPGPTFLLTNPRWLYDLSAGIVLSGFIFLFLGTYCGKALIRLFVATPGPAMAAIIATLCIIGSYAMNSNIDDVYLTFAFGIVGLVFSWRKFPLAPLVLGIVLSGELVDVNFRRALMAGKGSILPFFTRPLSQIMIVMILLMLYFQYCHPKIKAKWAKSRNKR